MKILVTFVALIYNDEKRRVTIRLRDLSNEYKCRISVADDYIAEHVGVSKSAVSRRMKGETKVMKPAVVEKLSYLLGTDVKSLLKNSDRFEKPPLGTAKAGYGLLAEENLTGYGKISKSDYYRGDYFLRVRGDSVIGAHAHDQNFVYVKQCDGVKSGTIAVILIGNTGVVVKRIIKKKPLLILEAASPAVPACYFTQEEAKDLPVEVTGKVLYSRSDIA